MKRFMVIRQRVPGHPWRVVDCATGQDIQRDGRNVLQAFARKRDAKRVAAFMNRHWS